MVREFHSLASIQEAVKAISSFKVELKVEEVPIEALVGRVLAEDVFSSIDVPAFDRAAMDGYAVIAEDTFEAREDRPVKLALIGRISTGELPRFEVKQGTAVEISTGAVIPKGANAVVMVEYAIPRKNMVLIKKAVSPFENIMNAGSDIMSGELVLRRGTRLGCREIGVLAAIGAAKAKVYKPLVAGVISTGNELASPGEKLELGKIYDANSYAIGAAVQECGGVPRYFGIASDDIKSIKKTLDRASQECDVILASGSTSAGVGDVMYKIIEREGKILIHGINIKPGKPTIIGIYRDKPFFGLPGYPASCLTIFQLIVAPFIKKIAGIAKQGESVRAKLAAEVKSNHKHRLVPVGVVRELAYPVDKGSGAITTLSEADGYIEIPEDIEYLAPGEEVEVKLFSGVSPPDLLFIGSSCTGVDILSKLLREKGVSMRIINTGSTGGFISMRRHIADLAGVHLFHESGVYNLPFIEEFKLKDVVLVKGYLREQGLISKFEIKGFWDIIEKNLAIINRNKGSGTRVLLDYLLKKYAIERGLTFEELRRQVRGYDVEVKTHSAVASAILLGRADAGLAIKPVAVSNKLHFLKLWDEEYDFLIPREKLNAREIKLFLELLKSKEFAEQLPTGMKTYKSTGEVIKL
ncbi:MAG: molybdopterin biosynthesis protein [Methanocellales archaeon]